MKQYVHRFILAILTLSLLLPMVSNSAGAVSGTEWRAGRIIDDSVFTNGSNMSVGEIQSFLNVRVPTCDTYGQQTSDMGGIDYNNDGRITRREYAQYRGYGSSYIFTCLKEYYEVPKTSPGQGEPASNYGGAPIPAGAQSAAQIISNAAIKYNISPKALLVKLATESPGPLTSDDWPFKKQYLYAMGAHCPDSGPGGAANCDPNWAGFSLQMDEAASLLRWYIDSMTQSWWQYKKPYQVNSILWNVAETGCGAADVYIESKATAALYTYTPYQPNQAALNNMYGTGDGCSAYGNRNFWRVWYDWFGSTIGPDYSWSIESLSYSGGDNAIGIGQTETATLKVRNTGRVPWYNHGDHPVRLGTWEPADRKSMLFESTRLATLQENSVAPGSVGTFTFSFTPTTKGTYVESLNLVAENHAWMAWPGLRPTISVTSANQWQLQSIVYGDGTGVMEPGTKQLITVIAKNTGTTTWSKTGPNPVRLGTWTPDRKSEVSATWLSKTRVTDPNETTVGPGQTAGFQFYVTVPASGNYYERLNLVSENKEWLNDTGLTLYLHGKTYQWQALWHSHSTGTANIPKNTNFTLTVKAKNTGEMTWRKDGAFPIRLATVGPQDRGSALYTSAWIRDTRPAALQEAIVEPGAEGTFVIQARTPSITGPRYERFSMIAEGVSWFNDPRLSIYVNVID